MTATRSTDDLCPCVECKTRRGEFEADRFKAPYGRFGRDGRPGGRTYDAQQEAPNSLTGGQVFSIAQAKGEVAKKEALKRAGVNPKEGAGALKPDLSLLPGAGLVQVAGVFALGASKYGAYNWRDTRVQARTYVAAMQRHILSWLDGETIDPESGENHLAHVVACALICLDAAASEKLVDYRPASSPTAELLRTKAKL